MNESTCWTLIRDAACGDAAARERFARLYLSPAKAYLLARWRTPTLRMAVEDTLQDLFLEFFRNEGALEKVDENRPGGFRAYFYGVLRNVARRHEEKNRRGATSLPDELPSDDTDAAAAFDRAWAKAIMKEAARVQQIHAEKAGDRAIKRVELLRLRFQNGMPIRDIATQWGLDAAKLHHEYATAREEFRQALREVVAFHHPHANAGELDRSCAELLGLLG